MKRKLLVVGLVGLLILVGCGSKSKGDGDVDDTIVKTEKGEYDLIAPFEASPIRYMHAINYREQDVMEVGRRLIEKSKEHFSTDSYRMSEGQVINETRYSELMTYKSTNNPNGLMTRYDGGLEIDGVKLERPVFLNGIFEIAFHKDKGTKVDGVSVALVLNRNQTIDSSTGAYHRLSDEALFKVGQSMGIQLGAYIRSLGNLSDVPIYIALYAQSSSEDKLPGNYLPGYYIGDALVKDNAASFKTNKEGWLMLSDTEATKKIPNVAAEFRNLRSGVTFFTGDESTSLIGKAFLVDNKLELINYEVNVGAKTFMEMYSVGRYIMAQLNDSENLDVELKVNIKTYQNTRAVIIKRPHEAAIFEVFE
jgi:protein involved in sex pheromone biosynthesis